MGLVDKLLIIGFCLLVGIILIYLGFKIIRSRQVRTYSGDDDRVGTKHTGKFAVTWGVQIVIAGIVMIVVGFLFAFGIIS